MTTRDRTVVMVLAVAAVIMAFWFGVLAPKRDTANQLASKIDTEQVRLQTAQESVTAGLAAERGYASDYATVARLGKAVPVQDDVPSLVYQLASASKASRINFDSIQLSSSGAAVAPAAAPAATTAGQVADLGKAQKGQATPAPAVTAAPATQAAAAGLPPGSVVGTAAFPTMPFDFKFAGRFFNLEGFLRKLDAYTSTQGSTINVRGRLMTIDGFALSGFPQMDAVMHATAYLLPDAQGLTAGATPQAPAAGATPASTTGTSNSAAPPVAVVTGVGR